MPDAYMPLRAGARSQQPNRVVIHAMAEFIDDEARDYFAVDWLQKLGLSVHALVTPTGTVIRCREDAQGAYHAKGFNTDSLGVEFLVAGLHTYPTFLEAMKTSYVSEEQLRAGVRLVRAWLAEHDVQRIDRHSDLSPGRKEDPGAGFPWQRLLDEVHA